MTLEGGAYKVELEVFEGPLDLLLHLVKKHELDIFDIPISFITARYLEYLDLMQSLSLDIAGEYLLMAATLAHIKSRELLPTPDPSQADDPEGGDEGEVEGDPRQELIRRLLEYQKYKEAAGFLGDRPVVGRNVWTRGAPREEALAENVDQAADAPLAPIEVFKLIEALDRVLTQAKFHFSHDVTVDRLSVADRINQLVDRLEREGGFSFSACFAFVGEGTRSAPQVKHDVVVTFLALLEMAKLRLIRLSQAEEAGDIFIAPAAADLRARASGAVQPDDYR